MKKMHSQQGFTLLELMVVLALIGILAGFFYPRLASSGDDAKVAAARTWMNKDFPAGISAQLARTRSCSTVTKDNLTKRGVNEKTLWGDSWTVSVTSNTVTLTYPLTSAQDMASAGADLATLKEDGIVQTSTFTSPNLLVTYRCQ